MPLAASSARFTASIVLMSGFGAPAGTAMAMPERTRSTRLPATILPSLIMSSIDGVTRITMSKVSPARSFLRMSMVPFQVVMSLCPLDRSNSGANAR